DLLGGVVLRADDARPLERHVLEHVREAGDPRDLLRRPDVGEGEEGEDRGDRTAIDEDRQAVRQLVDGEVLLESLHVLRGGAARGEDGQGRRHDERPKAMHASLPRRKRVRVADYVNTTAAHEDDLPYDRPMLLRPPPRFRGFPPEGFEVFALRD